MSASIHSILSSTGLAKTEPFLFFAVNGEIAIIWLGQAVSPQILNDLYGVENLDELDVRMTSLPKLPSYLSTQVRNILAHFERLYHKKLPVVIARQNIDGTETEFANMLVEDSNNDALSYVECEWGDPAHEISFVRAWEALLIIFPAPVLHRSHVSSSVHYGGNQWRQRQRRKLEDPLVMKEIGEGVGHSIGPIMTITKIIPMIIQNRKALELHYGYACYFSHPEKDMSPGSTS